MNQTNLVRESSRIAPSATKPGPFQLESLSVSEIETFTAHRLRALPGQDMNTLVDMNLPTETGSCVGDNPVLLCLRPTEWLQLWLSDEKQPTAIEHQPVDPGFYCWDESDGLGIVRVSGAAAAWLMRKNSGLDFTVDERTADHCTRCKFGKIRLLVYYCKLDDKHGEFNLIVERSLMKYLWTLLISTAPHAVEMSGEYETL